MEANVSQQSMISLILFATYLSEIFIEVEELVDECMTSSFADNFGWLVAAIVVAKLGEMLGKLRVRTLELGDQKHVTFDNAKDETIPLRRRSKPDLKRRIKEVRITVSRYTMRFNANTTRWLGVDLDTKL